MFLPPTTIFSIVYTVHSLIVFVANSLNKTKYHASEKSWFKSYICDWTQRCAISGSKLCIPTVSELFQCYNVGYIHLCQVDHFITQLRDYIHVTTNQNMQHVEHMCTSANRGKSNLVDLAWKENVRKVFWCSSSMKKWNIYFFVLDLTVWLQKIMWHHFSLSSSFPVEHIIPQWLVVVSVT